MMSDNRDICWAIINEVMNNLASIEYREFLN